MDKTGPIIIIDDDLDDQDLLRELFAELKLDNEVRFFPEGESALDYLSNPAIRPFLIISDVKMPRMDGFELRKQDHTSGGKVAGYSHTLQLRKRAVRYLHG